MVNGRLNPDCGRPPASFYGVIIMIFARRLVQTSALGLAGALALSAAPASAAVNVVAVGQTYTAASPYTFTFGDSSFTFTGTGDIFNPTAVSTGGTGQVNTIFGSPTTYFTDRGTVTFGPDMQYASFSSPTTIRFSNGNNFIGLRATSGSDVFFGYAFTTNNVLNSFAFNTTPGAAITASVAIPAAVPEPGTWVMMLLGFGAIGATMRRGRRVAATPQMA